MKIQIFGTGCPTCKKLFESTKQATAQSGKDIEVEYITDISLMIEKGIMHSPALVFNDKIVLAGYVPKQKDLLSIIEQEIG